MIKKTIFFLLTLIFLTCAYFAHMIYATRQSIKTANDYLQDIENKIEYQIAHNPEFSNIYITNQTFNLPDPFNFIDVPIQSIIIRKHPLDKTLYLTAILNPKFIHELQFNSQDTTPYIRMQYYIDQSKKISKSCYSNLPSIYLPKYCSTVKQYSYSNN